MITHFAGLELQTVSLQGVKQVYADRLGLPILSEDGDSIVFELTPFTTLTFVECYEPISPGHFAFEVPYSTYDKSVEAIKNAGLLIVGEINWDAGSMSLYFRDCDGHILEIYAHDYIKADVVPASHALRILYLREIGFPVDDMPHFRAWLEVTLGMQTPAGSDADDFSFVIGGTAHAVVVNKRRPWIPINMKALPPRMRVIFGTPDLDFLDQVRGKLQASKSLKSIRADEIGFEQENYALALRYTPEFPADLPNRLNLPMFR